MGKKYVAGVLQAVCLILALTACGDDPTVEVSVLRPEDIAISIEEEASEQEPDGEGENPNDAANNVDANNADVSSTDANNAAGEADTEYTEAEPITITISAAGDASLGNHQNQEYYYSFRQAFDKAENPGYFLENVSDIFSADDMTIVNFEGVLTTSDNLREEQTYCIKGEPEYAEILTRGSVEAATMGNNHRLDYKEQGSIDTVAALEKEGIVWAFEQNTGVYEVKGIQIGFVSVNEVSQGAAVEKTLKEGIDSLREAGADLVLACCHWGVEGEYAPEDYQKSLGRKCIDWGADLVIGHHPHVLQGVEEYQGKYIVYSLGNFCFGANRNPTDKDCMIFQQTFTFTAGEKMEDQNVRVIPCSVSSVSDRNDFKPTPASGEEAKRIIDKINGYSSEFGVQFDEEGCVINSAGTQGKG